MDDKMLRKVNRLREQLWFWLREWKALGIRMFQSQLDLTLLDEIQTVAENLNSTLRELKPLVETEEFKACGRVECARLTKLIEQARDGLIAAGLPAQD